MIHAKPISVLSLRDVKHISRCSFYQRADVIKIDRFELTVDEIFLKVFGRFPRWFETVVAAKRTIARVMGYRTPGIKKPSPFATELQIGEQLGLMHIKEKNQREIIAGVGDCVLISIYKRNSSEIVVTTFINTKTAVGKSHLALMKLLRKPVATYIVLRAVRAGRL